MRTQSFIADFLYHWEHMRFYGDGSIQLFARDTLIAEWKDYMQMIQWLHERGRIDKASN